MGKLHLEKVAHRWLNFVIIAATFGQVPASSLLCLILFKAAKKFCKMPETVEMIKKLAYVDDLVVGSDNKEMFENLKADVDLMIAKSGWRSHPWLDSSKPTLDELGRYPKIFGYSYAEDDHFVLTVRLNLSKKKRNKLLGADLQQGGDIEEYIKEHGLTKRLCLRVCLSAWDVTGYLLPLQMALRIHYRQTLMDEKQDLSWDEQVSPATKQRYVGLFKVLLNMEGLRWKRCLISQHGYVENDESPCLAILHDGSMSAANAVAYLVTERVAEDPLKEVEPNHVCIVTARGKLAPLRGSTIPRLELTSASLAAHLKVWVETNLPDMKIKKTYFLGDSTCAIRQIQSRAVLFSQFEQFRIDQIQHLVDTNDFYHISGKDNAADQIGRAHV